jgi:hypothetical protein
VKTGGAGSDELVLDVALQTPRFSFCVSFADRLRKTCPSPPLRPCPLSVHSTCNLQLRSTSPPLLTYHLQMLHSLNAPIDPHGVDHNNRMHKSCRGACDRNYFSPSSHPSGRGPQMVRKNVWRMQRAGTPCMCLLVHVCGLAGLFVCLLCPRRYVSLCVVYIGVCVCVYHMCLCMSGFVSMCQSVRV